MYIDSKSAVLSPSTIAGYEKIKRNYFTELMPFKLTKITAVMIQNSVNALSVNHSPKTVRNAHGLLSAVLKVYYPALTLNTTLPQKVKPQYTIPTTEDINKLLELADDRLRVPIKLASQGSLRRSEICALQPSDFNSFGVSITKAVVADNTQNLLSRQQRPRQAHALYHCRLISLRSVGNGSTLVFPRQLFQVPLTALLKKQMWHILAFTSSAIILRLSVTHKVSQTNTSPKLADGKP